MRATASPHRRHAHGPPPPRRRRSPGRHNRLHGDPISWTASQMPG